MNPNLVFNNNKKVFLCVTHIQGCIILRPHLLPLYYIIHQAYLD